MSDIADNSSVRNETKILLREVCVEYGIISHKYNQIKVKVKEVHIEADNASAERHNGLGWSDHETADEVVGNTPAPTAEEIENKLKALLVKELKHYFKNWRELSRGINWQQEFPKLETMNDII